MSTAGTTKTSGGAGKAPHDRETVESKARAKPGFDLTGTSLYIEDVLSDGSCLFRALSAQLYGNESKHPEIRARVTAWQRQHVDELWEFAAVNVYEHQRTRHSTRQALSYDQTPEGRRQKFLADTDAMAKSNVWGSEEEVQAFTQVYNTCVDLYSSTSPGQPTRPAYRYGENYATAGIACVYFNKTRQHYQSLRNRDGPHTGIPDCYHIGAGGSNSDKSAVAVVSSVEGQLKADQVEKGEDAAAGIVKDPVPEVKSLKRRRSSHPEQADEDGNSSDKDNDKKPAAKKTRLSSLTSTKATVNTSPGARSSSSGERFATTDSAAIIATAADARNSTNTASSYAQRKKKRRFSHFSRDGIISSPTLTNPPGQETSRRIANNASRSHDVPVIKPPVTAATNMRQNETHKASATGAASALSLCPFHLLPSFKKLRNERRKRSFSDWGEYDDTVADNKTEGSTQQRNRPRAIKKVRLARGPIENSKITKAADINGSSALTAYRSQYKGTARASPKPVPHQRAAIAMKEEEQEQPRGKSEFAISIASKFVETDERQDRRKKLESLAAKAAIKKTL